MLRQILTYDFGDLGHVIDRIEQFKLMVSEYCSDNVLHATFRAGFLDESMRDHLALHTGRLDTFKKMQATVRTRRGGSQLVPMGQGYRVRRRRASTVTRSPQRRSRLRRDSRSPQASRRCECSRYRPASRTNGRQKIKCAGSSQRRRR